MATQAHQLNLKSSFPTLTQNQLSYQSAFQKTLLAELEFLMDVVQGRIPDRKTVETQIKENIVQKIGSLLGQIPVIGSALEGVASAGGLYLLGEVEKKKKEDESLQLLKSFMALDRNKLDIITADCAREAACRWEMAINRFIDDQKGLMLFAVTGVVRVLEYLCRKRLPIAIEHLLKGISAGRSGSGYLNFTNTKIPLAKSMQMHLDNLKELSAEGLYGRCGYIVSSAFYIHDLVAGETEDKIKDNRKAKRGASEKHYGYVKFLKQDAEKLQKQIHNKRPKFGYVQLPNPSDLEFFAGIVA